MKKNLRSGYEYVRSFIYTTSLFFLISEIMDGNAKLDKILYCSAMGIFLLAGMRVVFGEKFLFKLEKTSSPPEPSQGRQEPS